MNRSIILASVLHGLILILVIFGLPQVAPPPLEVKPIIEVEVITISSTPNAAPNNPTPSPVKEPQPDPAPTPAPQPTPKPEVVPQPAPAPPPPPPPPKPPEPKPEPKPEPPKPLPPPPKPPEPKPEPKPEPPKPEPKPEPPKPEPKKEEVKKVEPPKPEPKKEDFFDMMSKTLPTPKDAPKVPPKPDAKPTEKKPDALDAIAKALNQPATPARPTQTAAAGSPAPRSVGPSDPNRPLSRAEEDGIRKAVSPCWAFDPGLANAKNLTVEVRLYLKPDGSVLRTELVDPSIIGRSPQHKAAAQTALRAPMNPTCNKLPISPGAYESVIIVFDPREMA